MMRLRDIRARARGDLHREMQVPVFFIRDGEEPILLGARIRQTVETVAPEGGAKVVAQTPTIIIRAGATQVSLAKSVVSVAEGEAYRISLVGPVISGFQFLSATRLTAAQLKGEGYPVPDELDWRLI